MESSGNEEETSSSSSKQLDSNGGKSSSLTLSDSGDKTISSDTEGTTSSSSTLSSSNDNDSSSNIANSSDTEGTISSAGTISSSDDNDSSSNMANSSDTEGTISSAGTISSSDDSDSSSSSAYSSNEEETSSSSKKLDSNGGTSSSLTSSSETIYEDFFMCRVNSVRDSRKEEEEEMQDILTFYRADFVATYIHQNFSLSARVMEYIAMNPASAELYQKLIQTCKYFLLKNPIIVVPRLDFEWEYKGGWSVELNGKRILLKNISSRFWVTGSISVKNVFRNDDDHQILSLLVQKLYRCDNKNLEIKYQNISINDLLLLASKCEYISLISNTVVEDDGSAVPCEKILASLPLVKDFGYVFVHKQCASQIFTSKTAKELIKLPHFATMKKLCLNLSENFDIEQFYEHIKGNNTTQISMTFWDDITAAHKTRLQAIVDEIVGAENHEYVIPFITFPGIDQSSLNKLLDLQMLFHCKML